MKKCGLKFSLVAIVVLQAVALTPVDAWDLKTSPTSKSKSAKTDATNSTLISKASAAIRKRRFKDAHEHLKKLASCGDCGAHNLLGVIYENGLGVEKNMNQAIVHYEFAAQKGLVSAQHKLGALYYHGKGGVPKDLKKARRWLRKAAAQGSREAREMLEQIPGVSQAELALKQAGDKFHEGGSQYETGMHNLEHSWKGYADLVTIMQQVGTSAAQTHTP